MAVKFQIGADYDDEDFGKLIRDFQAASAKLEDLNADLRETADSVEEVGNASPKVKDLTEETKKADRAVEKYGDSADKAGKKQDSMFSGLLKFELLKKGFEIAGRAVSAMAEQGSPAFIKLQESIGKVGQSLIAVGNDPAVQDAIKGLAGFITDTVVPAITAIPDTFRAVGQSFFDTVTFWGERVGLYSEGSFEDLQKTRREAEKLLEQRKDAAKLEAEEIKRKKQLEDLEKSLQGIEKARARDDYSARLDKIKDQEKLNKLEQEELDRLKDLQRQGKLTADDIAQGTEKVNAVWARQKSLIQEVRQEVEKNAEKQKQLAKDEEARRKQIQQAIKDVEVAGINETVKAAEDAQSQKAKTFEDYVDRIVAKLQEAKGEGKEGPALKFTDKQVQEQIAKKRAGGAKAEIEGRMAEDPRLKDIQQQRIADAEEDKAARGERDPVARSERLSAIQDRERERTRQERGIRRGYEAEGREAERGARKDVAREARRGELAPEETAEATKALTDETIRQGLSQGDLNKTQAAALRKAAENQAKLKADTDATKAEVEAINEFLDKIGRGGNRRRQQAGSKG